MLSRYKRGSQGCSLNTGFTVPPRVKPPFIRWHCAALLLQLLRYSIVLAILWFQLYYFQASSDDVPLLQRKQSGASYGGSNLTKLKAFKLVERDTPLLLLPNFFAIGDINVFILQQIVTMPVYDQGALNICHPHMTDIQRYT